MKRILNSFPYAIALWFFAAIAVTAASSLAGSEWGMAGQDMPFVRFEAGGRVTGHAGCNRFFGSYETDGEKFKAGPLGATRMACPGAVMEKEQAFLSSLQNARRFTRRGARLELIDGKGKVLTLVQRDWD
ncbi:META domain-containing protein [Salaquimonas pukyongi]|uniref:META domain-containing protein n=1 Tax=Salaquimonas pukyongi TaxID=2712698 RepID=UPI00096B7DF7|nr:META domain-containing protein [Salaquimonas pukyongi]